MIKITEYDLVKVNSVDEFFRVEAILYIDLVEVPKEAIIDNGVDLLFHNNKKYIVIALNGEPQNLILNMPFSLSVGRHELIVGFDAKGLPYCIKRGHIFDFSIFHRNKKYCEFSTKGYRYNYGISRNFLIENFINKQSVGAK